MSPSYPIEVRWLTAEEGGRQISFAGGRYTPTARLAGEAEQFSVVLEFPPNAAANPTKGTLRLLNPALLEVQRRIGPGVALEIMEGSRVVAHCVVESADVGAVVTAGHA